MGKLVNLSGMRFGRLSVITRAGSNRQNRALWLCRCDCGKETTVPSSCLTSGKSKSCGCLRSENTIKMNTTVKKISGTAPSRSRLYREWQGIRYRCENESRVGFHNYGGRGISVCDEWRRSFDAFRNWALANGYRDDLTIDRKDNDGPYCPENCRWVNRKAQAQNRRTCILISFNGGTHTISEWSEITGVKRSTLDYRIKAGWPLDKAFTPALGSGKLPDQS